MSQTKQVPPQKSAQPANRDGGARRRYQRPRLVRYGDIRTATLGASPTTGESGNPTFRG